MGLLKPNFDKPGPGVSRDTPRKKGLARLFEIMGRDFGTLLKVNLTFMLCALPALVFGFFSIEYLESMQFLLALIAMGLCAISGILVGPAFTALHFVIVKMLRDEPGFFWHDFWGSFKLNFKLSAFPGVLFALIINSQMLFLDGILFLEMGDGLFSLIVVLVSMLFFSMIYPYLFIQLAHAEIKVGVAIKNSILLAISNLPRSFFGVLVGPLLITIQWLYFPASPIIVLIILLLVGISWPCLFNLMNTFQPVDKVFEIEKTLTERRRQEAKTAADELMKPKK